MPNKTLSRTHIWWMLVGLLLAATYLGARMLAADLLFVDEYWSIRNSGGIGTPMNAFGIWEWTASRDPGGMGVLYHWLLGAWMWLVGITPFSVRAFSLLFGLLGMALCYRLGADFYGQRVGLFAAGALGLSAFYVDYLHEARAYSLLIAFTCWTVYCYLRIMTRRDVHRAWYIGLALGLGALAYTHYVALAMGAVLGVYHLLQFRRSGKGMGRWWAVIGAMALGGALFLPWLNITLEVIQTGTEDTTRQGDSMTAWQIIVQWAHTVSNANLALLVLLLGFSLVSITRRTLLLWIWLLLSVVLVIIVNALVPFMVHLRYLMFTLPAVALLVAYGMTRLRPYALAIVIVWWGAGVYQSVNPAFIASQFGQIYRAPAADFARGLDILNARGSDGNMLLLHLIERELEPMNIAPIAYYFEETDFVQPDLLVEQVEFVDNSFAGGDVAYSEDVEDTLEGVATVWRLIDRTVERTQRSDVLDYVLATQFDQCETVFETDAMTMTLYARLQDQASLATFQTPDDLALTLYDMGLSNQTDDTLQVVLGWWAAEVPTDTYSVALHLFDSNGALVRQADVGLENRRPFMCQSASLDISDLPTGDYTLRLAVYAWQTGERLSSPTSDDSDLHYIDLQSVAVD